MLFIVCKYFNSVHFEECLYEQLKFFGAQHLSSELGRPIFDISRLKSN